MAYNESNNTVSIAVDKDLEKKINNATSTAEIFEAVKAAYENAGLTERDYFNGDILYPTQKAFADPVLTRRFIVDGKEIVLTGASEAELNAAEIEMHRQLQAAPEEHTEQPARNERGQFVSAEDAAADAVVEQYLRRRGIDPQTLAESSNAAYTRSWEQSAAEFRSRHNEWAGGQENMQRIGEMVFSLGLLDADDKVAALEAAYAEIQKRGLYVRDTQESQAARAAQEIGTALSFEDIRVLGHRAIGIPPVNANLR